MAPSPRKTGSLTDDGDVSPSKTATPVESARVEVSLLPLKKRATAALASDSGGRHSDRSDDSYSPSKTRRVDECAGAESKNAVVREAPVPQRRRGQQPAAAAAAASPGHAEEDAAAKAERLRIEKGKWVATADPSSVAPPPVKKLMHDGIRSAARSNERLLLSRAPHAAVALAAAGTKPSGNINNTDDARGGAPADSEARLGPRLRLLLAELGATRARFVYAKRLNMSDVCTNQNRLLVSCKRESLAGCPITRCFNRREMRRVEDKKVGLAVTAFDRRCRPHALTCKFLDSNGGYRFISRWRDFLEENGLVLDGSGGWDRDVEVELWAFRSRELPRQPKLDAAGKPSKEEEDDHFHPDGSLGLLLLHSERRTTRRAEREEDDGEMGALTAAAREKAGRRDRRDTSSSAAAAPAAAPAPVARGEVGAGTTTSKVDEAGAATTTTTVEMVEELGEHMALAVMGLIRLRAETSGSDSGENENVEPGYGA